MNNYWNRPRVKFKARLFAFGVPSIDGTETIIRTPEARYGISTLREVPVLRRLVDGVIGFPQQIGTGVVYSTYQTAGRPVQEMWVEGEAVRMVDAMRVSFDLADVETHPDDPCVVIGGRIIAVYLTPQAAEPAYRAGCEVVWL